MHLAWEKRLLLKIIKFFSLGIVIMGVTLFKWSCVCTYDTGADICRTRADICIGIFSSILAPLKLSQMQVQ